MNKARRARKRQNHALAGNHSVLDHKQREDPKHPGHYLPVNCTKCLPPVTSGFKEVTRKQQLAQPTPPRGWHYKFKIGRRKNRKNNGGAHAMPAGK